MSFVEQLFLLNGKHAVVTGAASGLGRQCALTLARAGARMTLIDLNKTGLSETAKGIQGAPAAVCWSWKSMSRSRGLSCKGSCRRPRRSDQSISWSIVPGS